MVARSDRRRAAAAALEPVSAGVETFVSSELSDAVGGVLQLGPNTVVVLITLTSLTQQPQRIAKVIESATRRWDGQVILHWRFVRWSLGQLNESLTSAIEALSAREVAFSRVGVNVSHNRVEIAVDAADIRRAGEFLAVDTHLVLLAEGRFTAAGEDNAADQSYKSGGPST